MCRFTFYQGKPISISSLLLEPTHSLINQSFESLERDEPLNGDGFGLAWYNTAISSEPALFKSVSPAWSNNNLRELSRMIHTSCVLAHVRAATQSLSVSEANCHPFKWREYAFMHNGDIGGFPKIRRSMLEGLSDEVFSQVKGTTDSEHFFALFIDAFLLRPGLELGDRMASSMMAAIRQVIQLMQTLDDPAHAYMNMVVTNGDLALAVRFTTDEPGNADSLYINLGKKYVCQNGVCFMQDPGEHEKSVIISSEPLSQDVGWRPIPVNSMVLVQDGRILNEMTIQLD